MTRKVLLQLVKILILLVLDKDRALNLKVTHCASGGGKWLFIFCINLVPIFFIPFHLNALQNLVCLTPTPGVLKNVLKKFLEKSTKPGLNLPVGSDTCYRLKKCHSFCCKKMLWSRHARLNTKDTQVVN